jgi:preprotein translocase subunit SecA
MAEKAANIGPDIFRQLEKSVVLQILDQQWKEHLLRLDHLRQGINLRAFGQRDPLNEYKTEAFGMFEEMLFQLREQSTQMLSLVQVNAEDGRIGFVMPGTERDMSKVRETRSDPAMSDDEDKKAGPYGQPKLRPAVNKPFDSNDPETWVKTPRNSPCPCGSGKKYKHCHGKL